MKCVILPYGNAGWSEKIRIIERLMSSKPGPPFLYNDVLLLVPSSRMKRTYGRLFLDLAEREGSPALVQPDIRTFHQFMEQEFSRLSGPRLMDEISRLVLIEGLVKDRLISATRFNQDPDLLAPALSAAIATMIEELSAAGVTAGDLSRTIQNAEFFDKPHVKLLIDVFGRYGAALRENNLTDPAGMRSHLIEHFDPTWLSQYREIIIDGVPDAGRLETAILRKVAECGNCTFLVDAPSSDLLNQAGEFHPLRITRDVLADVGAAPEQGAVTACDDDLFIAHAIFSDIPFDDLVRTAPAPSSFTRDIRLLSAVNPREEVSLIAGMVKKAVRSGIAPDSLLVAFPGLDEYGPLVEEIFSDYGIPYNRALGRQLSASAVATAVVSLLSACQEDFSGPSLLRVFSSPFLKFSEQPAIAAALDRFMRRRRITGGRERLLAALRHHAPDEESGELLPASLTDLFTALGPFSAKDAAGLSSWMERLSILIAWSGLAGRVARIKGPLNINLQAHTKLIETLASLARAGRLFPGYTYTFNEWVFLLKKTFMHARFQVPPEDESGVQIRGHEEGLGHPWSEIYLGGLVDNKFPRRLPQNIFLPEATLETLGVRTLEKARLKAASHFYRLLLSSGTVTLTYPENEGDRPAAASPFLEELTPLRKAGLLNRGIGKTSGLQFTLKPEDCRSIPELAKAIALAGGGTIRGLPELLDADLAGMAGIRAAVEDRRAGPSNLFTVPAKREFRVTELEDYLSCPYDYYVRHVLAIEPLEEVSEDISARDRGTKVHSILRNFYRDWKKPVTSENREAAKGLLRDLAGPAFDREADTVRNRREKDLFLNVMAERFLDAEEDFWKTGMRPAYLEQKIEQYPLVLSDGSQVKLSAKIDRIDVAENGDFMIVDYKTGDYPKPRMTIEQDIFQLPLYAVMARNALAGNGPPLKDAIGLVYYDLSNKTGAGARDVVLYNKEARSDHPSSKPKTSPKSAAEFEAILKQSLDKARAAVEGIIKGDFAVAPREESLCRYCPNGMMCETSDEREQ